MSAGIDNIVVVPGESGYYVSSRHVQPLVESYMVKVPNERLSQLATHGYTIDASREYIKKIDKVVRRSHTRIGIDDATRYNIAYGKVKVGMQKIRHYSVGILNSRHFIDITYAGIAKTKENEIKPDEIYKVIQAVQIYNMVTEKIEQSDDIISEDALIKESGRIRIHRHVYRTTNKGNKPIKSTIVQKVKLGERIEDTIRRWNLELSQGKLILESSAYEHYMEVPSGILDSVINEISKGLKYNG